MMKRTYQITIEKPLEEVIDLFNNPSNFKHWQKGLIDSKNLTGKIGQKGSKRNIKIKTSVATIQMVEEITAVDLPHLWEATYRSKGVTNFQSNRFRESVSTVNKKELKQTVWDASTIFKFSGMMRLVAKARPQIFESQTEQFMQDFKNFAENGISVYDS